MDKITMVSVDIARSSELLDALDRAKIKVSVAFWAFLSEYEDWRLVVSSRRLDLPDPRDAYGLLHETLAPAGFAPRNTPPLMILPTKDPFIRELRRIFGKTNSTEGMRLGGQLIGGRFVQDAYVYRIS
jgi:hypothetical protein